MRPRQRTAGRHRPRAGAAHERTATPRRENQATHRAIQRTRRGGHSGRLSAADERVRAGGARRRRGDRRGGAATLRQSPHPHDRPRRGPDRPARGQDPRLRRRKYPRPPRSAARFHGRAPPGRRVRHPVRRRAADHLSQPRAVEGDHAASREVQVGRSGEPGQQGAENLRVARRTGLTVRV